MDGKSWFSLGRRLPEAYKVWAARVGAPERVTTVAALLDRYAKEVVPKKQPKTQGEYHCLVARGYRVAVVPVTFPVLQIDFS